jgi:sugar phosphate isomerase/epimerase
MIRSAVTISLVQEARGGPFVFWDDLSAGCAGAASAGFDAVEIFAPGPTAISQLELKTIIERHNLTIAAFGTGAGWVKHKLRLTDPDAGVRAKAEQFVSDLIDAAAPFHAPVIIGSMQGRCGDGVTRDVALNWLGDALGPLSERAARHDLPLLYEPLNRYETNLFCRVNEALEFLNTHRLRNVKLLCDLFHMNIEEQDVAAALRLAGPHLGHVHWADSNRRAVGFGHLDMRPIVSALREIQYEGFVSAEVLPLPDSQTAAKQTIASLQQYKLCSS